MSLIDISQRLRSAMPVWPGDTPYSFDLTWTKEQSGSVNVGKLVMGTHTGTHIDAPFHFDSNGQKVIDLDLNLYIGPVRVLTITGKETIGASDLTHVEFTGVERLLIRTDSWKDLTCFPTEFSNLRPDIAPFLAKQGVRLIGVDVPSVDHFHSEKLPTHHALLEQGIHILEGAVLREVEDGEYELIALPLALEEGDGSPVRAVLRKL